MRRVASSPPHPRHVQIHEYDVGLRHADELQCFLTGRRLAGKVDRRQLPDQSAQALPEKWMIVHDEHAGAHRRVLSVQRQHGRHRRAIAATDERQCAPVLVGAGLHRAPSGSGHRLAETGAVVADCDHELAVVGDQRHLATAGVGMADDVGHRLAGDAICSELDLGWQRAIESAFAYSDRRRARCELVTQRVECAGQPEFVEWRRSEVLHEACTARTASRKRDAS